MEDKPRTGNSKKAQLKEWRRYFDWENPTKQIYRITEVYDIPKEKEDLRKNNGGFREGSGRKVKMKEEFDCLLNQFFHKWFNRNSYNGTVDLCTIYFTNNEASLHFGLYSENFCNATKDFKNISVKNPELGKRLFAALSLVRKKISEKRRSWIYNEINKIEKIEFGKGIIAYKDKDKTEYEHRDDLLERWKEFRNEYMKVNGIKSTWQLIDKDMWNNMSNYVSSKFEEYESVKLANKLKFDIRMLKMYDESYCKECRLKFNSVLTKELKEFFSKRTKEEDYKIYEYIIDKYVKIKDIQTMYENIQMTDNNNNNSN